MTTYYRAFWSHMEYPHSGCIEGKAETLQEFLDFVHDRINENYGGLWEIDGVGEFKPVLCPHCSEPMGNMGLIYDECLNDNCDLRMQDPRPFMTGPDA